MKNRNIRIGERFLLHVLLLLDMSLVLISYKIPVYLLCFHNINKLFIRRTEAFLRVYPLIRFLLYFSYLFYFLLPFIYFFFFPSYFPFFFLFLFLFVVFLLTSNLITVYTLPCFREKELIEI